MSKKVKITLILVATLVLVCAVVGLASCQKSSRIELNDINVKQNGKEQSIDIAWETSGGGASKVEIVVKKSSGLIDSSTTISNPSLLAKGKATIYASYGKNTVEVTVSNKKNSDKMTKEIAVSTDEYVIAPLVATMPVTLFSLRMGEFTNNYTIPTFVWLQRGLAWNYNKMPDNVNLMPVSTYEEMSGYLGDNYSEMYYKTSKWVGELYEINHNAKFHFYVNDYHPIAWLQCTYLNQIPAANYDVTLLTDGTASNAVFESLYTSDSAVNDYNKMVEEYNSFKQDLWDKHNPDRYNNLISVPLDNLKVQKWIIPMLKVENNVKIILSRAYFTGNDETTNATIKQYVNELTEAGKIEVVNLYTLLNALTEEGKQHIKDMYKFSDNMFEKAVTENKTAMVIMGTRTANEKDFEAYVAATKAVYGEDNYVYYYKGHPWTPTASDPDKAKKLEELGLIDVDSSIAAELIFFFNQDIVATGYSSTTFKSLNANQVGGVFGSSLEDALATCGDNVKFVINEMSLLHNDYKGVASAGDMVVEFADKTNYDIAVCKVGSGKTSIKYYKLQGTSYVEVNK